MQARHSAVGRFPGVGDVGPLKYSSLENSMVEGSQAATVHQGHKVGRTERLTALVTALANI